MLGKLTATILALSLASTAALAAPAKKKTKPPRVQSTGAQTQTDINARYSRDPNAVFYAGTYVGSDPDPRVRAQMLREAPRAIGDGR